VLSATGVREAAFDFGEEISIGVADAVPSDEDSARPEPIDPYALVVEHLVAFCAEARTIDVVAAAFSLEPSQARAWLARAARDMRVRRLTKPIRYQSIA
jgi:hypothetical protein